MPLGHAGFGIVVNGVVLHASPLGGHISAWLRSLRFEALAKIKLWKNKDAKDEILLNLNPQSFAQSTLAPFQSVRLGAP